MRSGDGHYLEFKSKKMSAPPAHRFFRSLRDTNWPAVEFVKSPDTCVAAFQYWCLQFFSVFPSTPAFRSASGPSPSGFCRPGSFTVGQKSGSGAGSMRGLSQGCLREQRSDLRGSATCVFHRIADFRDPREQTGHRRRGGFSVSALSAPGSPPWKNKDIGRIPAAG